jgi:hypothetical protein
MEAIKLAFDTIIVGTLALPWLLIILDLFFASEVRKLWEWLTSFKDQEKVLLSAAGVVVFAHTYFAGALVTRASQDVFDDNLPRWFPTEGNIRKAQYCKVDPGDKPPDLCQLSLKKAKEMIDQDFHTHEAKVLLKGVNLDRLNQLYSQLSILRGAAFNGLLTTVLSLLAWCRQIGRDKWPAWVVPAVPLLLGIGVLFDHSDLHGLTDPPYMEVILVLLAIAGWIAASTKDAPSASIPYGTLSLLAAALTLIAVFGWWWSELLYDEGVYDFYQALS